MTTTRLMIRETPTSKDQEIYANPDFFSTNDATKKYDAQETYIKIGHLLSHASREHSFYLYRLLSASAEEFKVLLGDETGEIKVVILPLVTLENDKSTVRLQSIKNNDLPSYCHPSNHNFFSVLNDTFQQLQKKETVVPIEPQPKTERIEEKEPSARIPLKTICDPFTIQSDCKDFAKLQEFLDQIDHYTTLNQARNNIALITSNLFNDAAIDKKLLDFVKTKIEVIVRGKLAQFDEHFSVKSHVAERLAEKLRADFTPLYEQHQQNAQKITTAVAPSWDLNLKAYLHLAPQTNEVTLADKILQHQSYLQFQNLDFSEEKILMNSIQSQFRGLRARFQTDKEFFLLKSRVESEDKLSALAVLKTEAESYIKTIFNQFKEMKALNEDSSSFEFKFHDHLFDLKSDAFSVYLSGLTKDLQDQYHFAKLITTEILAAKSLPLKSKKGETLKTSRAVQLGIYQDETHQLERLRTQTQTLHNQLKLGQDLFNTIENEFLIQQKQKSLAQFNEKLAAQKVRLNSNYFLDSNDKQIRQYENDPLLCPLINNYSQCKKDILTLSPTLSVDPHPENSVLKNDLAQIKISEQVLIKREAELENQAKVLNVAIQHRLVLKELNLLLETSQKKYRDLIFSEKTLQEIEEFKDDKEIASYFKQYQQAQNALTTIFQNFPTRDITLERIDLATGTQKDLVEYTESLKTFKDLTLRRLAALNEAKNGSAKKDEQEVLEHPAAKGELPGFWARRGKKILKGALFGLTSAIVIGSLVVLGCATMGVGPAAILGAIGGGVAAGAGVVGIGMSSTSGAIIGLTIIGLMAATIGAAAEEVVSRLRAKHNPSSILPFVPPTGQEASGSWESNNPNLSEHRKGKIFSTKSIHQKLQKQWPTQTAPHRDSNLDNINDLEIPSLPNARSAAVLSPRIEMNADLSQRSAMETASPPTSPSYSP
ncbi:MAG: hypothetical protein H0W64_07980 [Gammaproteobacteria bacterium]|nr:hypothetical protein [Gammaproteobacteria bacterium]